MTLKGSCPVWREDAGKVPNGNSPTSYSTSCPVWREDAGKVPYGNSPTSYSTARRDLWGRCRVTGTSTRQVVLGSTLQLLGNRPQDQDPSDTEGQSRHTSLTTATGKNLQQAPCGGLR